MMYGYGRIGGWPVWADSLMWIGMLAFLGVLIWAGYTLISNSSRDSYQQRRGDQGDHERRHGADARGVLDERLARGEIDGAEYHRLRGLIAAGDDQAPLPHQAGSGSRASSAAAEPANSGRVHGDSGQPGGN